MLNATRVGSRLASLALFFVVSGCSTTPTQSTDDRSLGMLEFPTSGAPEATPDFIRGVLYLHSFEYDLAAEQFRRAQSLDPQFAMAYWGETMTFHHSLWAKHFQQDGQAVLSRLGKTAKERAAKAQTQREKGFIRAVGILFGMTAETKDLDKLERDVRYRNAMRELHEAYPDDLEVRAFYGLSILGVGSANRDYATYIRAAAIITPVWEANRLHPGGAHYLIHSYDDPVHAILGLPMARAYGEYAVGAAHAQHMTSHIYVALGLWDDMINANITALDVESSKTIGEGARSREAWHHRYWLTYGRQQQGHLDDAEALLKTARGYLIDSPLPREPSYYGAMVARYLIDTEKWNDADKWLAPADIRIPTPHYAFVRAFSAIKLGDLDTARDLLAAVRPGGLGNPEIILSLEETAILKLELDAMLALAEGDDEKAVELAREAVAQQTSMPFRYGPPRISKPTAELLGDILLELDRPEEAALAYEDQLSRSQMRTNSLLGLARAHAQAGNASAAAESYRALADVWHSADPDLPGLAEARESAGRD
jgi:tetratricopeptide (TPR) repeat protein